MKLSEGLTMEVGEYCVCGSVTVTIVALDPVTLVTVLLFLTF